MKFVRRLLWFQRECYLDCFQRSGKSGRAVLADLRRFCRAREEHVDIEAVLGQERDLQLVQLGRVQVYRRIRRYLDVTDEQMDALEAQLSRTGE